MKKYILEGAIFLGFIATIIIVCVFAMSDAKAVQSSVLRLHVLANSNANYDQELKLRVKDEISKVTSKLFKDVPDKNDAIKIAKDNIKLLEDTAKAKIKREGYNYDVKVEVGNVFFPTKKYPGISLPAGNYDAIRVLIGNAEGQNWWCVMFPPVCISPAMSKPERNKEIMGDVLQGSPLDLVTKDNINVKFEFKVVEIIENLKEKLFH